MRRPLPGFGRVGVLELKTANRVSEPPEELDQAVHVWLCRLDPAAISALARSSRAVLSADECRRADRFLRQSRRQMFEVAHALVRQALSQYADVAPGDWSFATNRWGRPEIAGPVREKRFSFSLSHTHGLVACAIAAGVECGVDVESMTRAGDPLRIARRVLSARELTDLETQPSETKQSRLLEYWTLKEAYLKARGVGMSVAMRDLSFALDDPGIRLVTVDADAKSSPDAWSFTITRPTSSHTLALALGPPDGPSRTVEVREGLPRQPKDGA
jgi:4'-phosphopantetheinyl transferase